MGHAYPEKISKFINAQLRLGSPVTVTDLVDKIIIAKIPLSTAEGLYEGDEARPTISHAVEQIMEMLHSAGQVDPRPVGPEQKRIWQEWLRGEVMDWDNGDDGRGGEYGIFDAIPWHPLKKRFWIIRRLEN